MLDADLVAADLAADSFASHCATHYRMKVDWQDSKEESEAADGYIYRSIAKRHKLERCRNIVVVRLLPHFGPDSPD
ncbi:MAG: hypothetical protein CMJ50_05940 [Planctomycetaceae bacterium]|nr:hypothetical protein [Planctomycetaceae bacterium]